MTRSRPGGVSRRHALAVTGTAALLALTGCTRTGGSGSRAVKVSLTRVDDFGAKGDGIADDTKAIRAAIAALPDGGTLVFTPGKTYLTSATVEIANRAEILVDVSGSAITTTAASDTSAVLRVENCRRVHVTGGLLSHRNRGPRRNAADGLTVNHCSHVLVKNVRVGYVYSMGIRASGSSHVTITDCSVDGSAADGIGTYGGQRQAAVPAGVVDSGSTTLTSANSNFRVQDVGSTVTVFGAGDSGGNLVTTIARWLSRTQVTLADPARTTVSHQYVKIQRPSAHITIVGNRLVNTGDDAISSVGYLTYTAPNTDVVVRGNTVAGSHARGILLTGTSHGLVSGNTLRQIKMGGVFLVVEVGAVTTWGCSDVVIDNNVIETVGTGYPEDNYPGIGAASTDDRYPIRNVSITNNIIRDAYSYYIGIGGYSTSNGPVSTRDVTIRANKCIGGNRNNPAIQVIKSTNVTITDNSIAKPRASAVTVTPEVAGQVIVRDNVVSQYNRKTTGYPALDIGTPTPTVDNNVVNGVRITSGTSGTFPKK